MAALFNSVGMDVMEIHSRKSQVREEKRNPCPAPPLVWHDTASHACEAHALSVSLSVCLSVCLCVCLSLSLLRMRGAPLSVHCVKLQCTVHYELYSALLCSAVLHGVAQHSACILFRCEPNDASF